MVGFAMRWWLPFVVSVGGILAFLSVGPTPGDVVGDSDDAFVTVLALTIACALGAVAVTAFAFRRRLAELALLGTGLWAVSLLPLVHGLLLPGQLYGPNPGATVALVSAVPAGLVAAAPLLLDGTRAGQALAVRWRAWTVTFVLLVSGMCAALLIWPHAIPAPALGGPIMVVVVAVSLAGTTLLSLRHLRLFAIGRRAGSLIASLGFISPGLATIAFLGAEPLSAGWWLAHLVDGLGVLFAAVGLLAHWRDRSVAFALSPVLSREPLIALELGLTPVVHRFVASLEAKDKVTREHVARVGELAIRAGERAGLGPLTLRFLGLGALLHDIGKLLTPDAVLTKPAALTDAERAVVERHSIDGELLLSTHRHLRPAARIVRSHHERPDGRGYPDGLTAPEIPLPAAIVSVVDAWDAMVSDRPYRKGMSHDRARAIIRGGAGSQWRADAVQTVLEEIDHRGAVEAPRLAGVGRTQAPDADARVDELAGCLPNPLPFMNLRDRFDVGRTVSERPSR